MRYIEWIIIISGWTIGNIIFNNFEKHLHWSRRILKLILILIFLYIADLFFGRIVIYSILALMLIGIILLHFYWFPKKGINGITAEPYNKYLKLINKIKKNLLIK